VIDSDESKTTPEPAVTGECPLTVIAPLVAVNETSPADAVTGELPLTVIDPPAVSDTL
jgi:hypothetical protein